MQIRILHPGLLTTVQDLGRQCYRSQAIPVSGAMDQLSARIANIALGNPDNGAVLECTYAGLAFQAETSGLISYAGDGAILRCGEIVILPDRPVFVPAGQVLRLTNTSTGCRSYIAVAGGWDAPEVLGSRSTYLTAALGGYQGRALQGGDLLSSANTLTELSMQLLTNLEVKQVSYPNWSIARNQLLPRDRKIIRIVPAHEFNWFDGSAAQFLSQPYTLTMQSNRMGYQLEGPEMERVCTNELLSTAVVPGTIQVSGGGNLILLMADAQTTGGYPRIGQVAAVDMPLCGQLKPGDQIYFQEISWHEAEMLYLEREQQLRRLAIAIQYRIGSCTTSTE